MALALRAVQNIPDCLRRLAITVRQAASCSGADKEVVAAERGVARAFTIAFEIVRLSAARRISTNGSHPRLLADRAAGQNPQSGRCFSVAGQVKLIQK